MKLKQPKYRFESVLLVDDNELDNFINQRLLKAYHFAETIYVCASAPSALDFMRNLKAGKQPLPAVAFIDLNMPLMDGFQLLAAWTQDPDLANAGTRLVVLTSSVNEQDRQKALSYDKKILFLNKPLTEQALATIING